MSVEQYKVGTVTVTNGSNIITGSGTAWTTNVLSMNAFMIQEANAPIYTVLAVDSDTQVRISVPYVGTSGSGKAYAIQRSFDPLYGMPRPSAGDFGLPAMISKIVDITAGVMAAGGGGGISLTLSSIVALQLAVAPRSIWEVYGDSPDGGATPDTATQASINALITAGVPSANIIWNYIITGASIQMPSVSRAPIINVLTLTGIGGGGSGLITMSNTLRIPIFVVPTLVATSNIGIITMPNTLRTPIFTVPNLYAALIGLITMPTQSRTPTFAVPTLISGIPGLITMPTQSRTPVFTVPTLVGLPGSGGSFSDLFNYSNGNNLGSDWTTLAWSNTGRPYISNSMAVIGVTYGQFGAMVALATLTLPANQWVSGTNHILSRCVAGSSSGYRGWYDLYEDGQVPGYMYFTVVLYPLGGANLGTWHIEGGGQPIPTKIRIRANGSTIALDTYYNGTWTERISVTDTTYTSGQAGFMFGSAQGIGGQPYLGTDDFDCGSL